MRGDVARREMSPANEQTSPWLAHKTGAAFEEYGAHIIHGSANAMYLPKVIAFNAKDATAKKRYADVADFLISAARRKTKSAVDRKSVV